MDSDYMCRSFNNIAVAFGNTSAFAPLSGTLPDLSFLDNDPSFVSSAFYLGDGDMDDESSIDDIVPEIMKLEDSDSVDGDVKQTDLDLLSSYGLKPNVLCTMDVKALNKYKRLRGLSEDVSKELSQIRRRLLNKGYQKTSRNKKYQASKELKEENGKLKVENEMVKGENAVLKTLILQLMSEGRVTMEEMGAVKSQIGL